MDIKDLKNTLASVLKGYNSKSYGRILKFTYPDLLQAVESFAKPYGPSSITESIYIVLHGVPVHCTNGSKPIFAGFKEGYRQFCGPRTVCKCSRLNQSKKLKQWQESLTPEQRQAMQARAENTFMENHGVSNPMRSAEIKTKIETNNLQKYGVRHSINREQVQEKIRSTLMEKYGVDSPFKSIDIMEKAQNTTKQRYGGLMRHARNAAYNKHGGKNPFADPDVQKKISQTMISRYGVVRALQNPDIMGRMIDNNLKKHGRPNPSQFHYSPEFWAVLQDRDLFLDCVKGKSSVQVATQFNTRSDLIIGYARRYDVLDQMNFQPKSAMEDDLCEWLESQQVPFKRNDKKVLQGLELDIFLEDHQLAIELNGLYQHSEIAGKKNNKYHWHKTKGCEIKGIQLLHVWQDEYWSAKQILQAKILYLSKKITLRTHARQCVITPINNAVMESNFLKSNHIQGFAGYRQHSMAAWYDGQLVGIMSFAYRKGRLELVRYATDVNRICAGLFTRMLGHSVKEFGFAGKIVSQSDNRISNGSLYLKTGWQYEGEQAPTYCYTGDYATRQNKESFMKKKLIKRFGLEQSYVDANTEWQIAQDLGYDRLWDAGKKIWSITV
jgi:hypothetical protein